MYVCMYHAYECNLRSGLVMQCVQTVDLLSYVAGRTLVWTTEKEVGALYTTQAQTFSHQQSAS